MAEYETPTIDIRYGAYNGTKTNSAYFWHYLSRIYHWRQNTGLIPNIEKMDSLTMQVDCGKRIKAVKELLLTSAYDFQYTFEDTDFITSVLCYKNDPMVPVIFIREPKSDIASGIFRLFNDITLNRKGSSARFIGEAYLVKDIDDVYRVQSEAGTRFFTDGIAGSVEDGIRWIETLPSVYTQNTVKYVRYYGDEKVLHPKRFNIITESAETLRSFSEIKDNMRQAGITDIVLPVDHVATRIFHHDREDAILEIVKLTHMYPWGAYNIDEMDSSTNPVRNVYNMPERHSPAKVFTAGNCGAFLRFLSTRPAPTETFCENFGRSLHHIAYDVKEDDMDGPDNHNIDTVVSYLKKNGFNFVDNLTGTKAEGLRQVFSKRSPHTGWVTEYVERFGGFHGFFTRKNVAFLTQAAGKDEGVIK
ncbi:MAG: hypothetical protein H7844_12470 [Nitrospirae bacterium YQR-1]